MPFYNNGYGTIFKHAPSGIRTWDLTSIIEQLRAITLFVRPLSHHGRSRSCLLFSKFFHFFNSHVINRHYFNPIFSFLGAMWSFFIFWAMWSFFRPSGFGLTCQLKKPRNVRVLKRFWRQKLKSVDRIIGIEEVQLDRILKVQNFDIFVSEYWAGPLSSYTTLQCICLFTTLLLTQHYPEY